MDPSTLQKFLMVSHH